MTVKLTDVSRRFGSITALDAATLDAPAGEITVLLGPNGAGKTTAIRLITGALDCDEGSVRVFGLDPTGQEGESIRRRCGVVTAKPSLYDRLDGLDNLRYAAELFGLGRGKAADDRIVEAATQFGIEDSLGHQVGGYSTGMKTRLALARAVLHEPDLLLLDEPTSGLDPESAAAVLDLIRSMTADGRTVLMCTHLLLEAEGLADRIVVMDEGTTVVSGAPGQLSTAYWPDRVVTIGVESADADGAAIDAFAGHRAIKIYERDQKTVRATLDADTPNADLLTELVRAGIRVASFEQYKPSLEDLYFAIRRGQPPTGGPAAGPPSSTRASKNGVAGSDNGLVGVFP